MPEIVRCQVFHLIQPLDRRDQGACAGGDDDITCCQGATGDLDSPWIFDHGRAVDDFDAHIFKALGRIVRFYLGNNFLNPFHHLGEIELDIGAFKAKLCSAFGVGDHLGAADQCLARYTARIETIPAHLLFFDQCDPGFDCTADECRDQAGATGSEHDQVVVECLWPSVVCVDLACFNEGENFFGQQREDPQQGKAYDHGCRKNPCR